MRNLGMLWAGLALAIGWPVRGAETGSEVIVVYNSRMPESKEIAQYYAKRRDVPASQVFGFELTTNQDMTREDFRNALQKPLAHLLEDKKLWHIGADLIKPTNNQPGRVEWKVKQSKIRYAVLCYGVPVRIVRDPNLKEPIEEKLRPELCRNEAAVDSELALLPCIEQDLPLAGPLKNPLFTATNAAWFNPTNGILMVTRLDGPGAAIARELVDKAIQAETDGLWGRAYFDVRNVTDPNYKPGDNWIRTASEICSNLGFETIVDERPETFPAEFPMSQIAVYCGWYDANVSGPFTRTNVEFMPGAFAYHLHSTSAMEIRNPSRFWVGPFLAKGATATMGAVDEPYLDGTPEVAVFVARWLYEGFTFGEAAYASQPVLSWQITFVGDPLYSPLRKSAETLHQQLTAQHNPLLEWSFLRLVNLNLARGRAPGIMANYLEQVPLLKQSAVLTEKLADIYDSLGKPSSALETYEAALQRHPSPEQRVRLRLILGQKLAAAGKDQEAFDDYAQLLHEMPDYPEPIDIYRQLHILAVKMGKKDEAAKYQDLIHQLTSPPAETGSK